MQEQRIIRTQLHEKVAELLRGEILSQSRPGDKLDGERTLAVRFGVSVGTVRESLRSLAQNGLVHRRHGSGTYVSDRSASRHVGILIELEVSHPRASRFHLRVGQELKDYLAPHGIAARLYLGRTTPGSFSLRVTCPEFTQELEAGNLSAVVAVVAPYDRAWMAPLQRQKLPVLGLWTDVIPYRVDLDYEGMVERGARYLMEHGRRNLALLGWSARSLTQAFRRVTEAAGVRSREAWIRTNLHPSLPGAGWAEFRELWMACGEKPDGLLILDDMLFDDVKTAILELGIRVPEQLMVVTHANKGAGLTAPFPFAQAEFDPDECAHHLGGMLRKLLSHEPVETPVIRQGFEWNEAETGNSRPLEVMAAKTMG